MNVTIIYIYSERHIYSKMDSNIYIYIYFVVMDITLFICTKNFKK